MIHFQTDEKLSKESGKDNYINLKRVVWHTAFCEILQSIADYSKTGCTYMCADGIKWLLFPVVLILSADYEEQ